MRDSQRKAAAVTSVQESQNGPMQQHGDGVVEAEAAEAERGRYIYYLHMHVISRQGVDAIRIGYSSVHLEVTNRYALVYSIVTWHKY